MFRYFQSLLEDNISSFKVFHSSVTVLWKHTDKLVYSYAKMVYNTINQNGIIIDSLSALMTHT